MQGDVLFASTPIYGIDSTIINKTNGLHIAMAKILTSKLQGHKIESSSATFE